MTEIDEAGHPGQTDFLPFLLNRVAMKLNADFELELESFGLTFTQWRVLAFLHEKDDLSILALSEATSTEASTLSRALAKMEQRGWISRVQDATDRRSMTVHLQRTGRDVYKKALAIAMRILNVALGGMSRDDMKRLRRSLLRIEANFDEARSSSDGSAQKFRGV